MNCDQVFSVLTRGPFPTGAPSDLAVEDHLERCADCWRIAEALRPAHDVFEESIPAWEGRDLPGYWGDAQPAHAAYSQVQQAALRTAVLPSRKRQVASAGSFVPYSVSSAVGWMDVARITSFLVAIGSAAFTVAWLWQ